ncbi:DUF6542 domain-containing protein [Streptomyces sp. S.PB5]|uniref:DUF6542 domain-containing protein n=1 Tax=Streptomyces sp. S.PB5 TaxID=3020844 RepID=UPI0025AEF683|nr:DUF6542 domain-containing protein [Streptomyces sp. S.PB5]MDN3028230.1 hypothetical protein [Streptomyces sp. S.PB5]
MEQHKTRPPHIRARREAPSLPPQAARGGRGPTRPAAVRRPAPPVAQAVRRFPNPRLTGLGGGLFCIATMLVLGCLDALTFGSLTVYGVLFLPVSVLTAVWMRRNDLVTAPVVVPIAFAAGLVPLAQGGDGIGSRLMGLVTALATEAGWLYGGTLVAGLIATVRKVRLMNRRRRANRPPV